MYIKDSFIKERFDYLGMVWNFRFLIMKTSLWTVEKKAERSSGLLTVSGGRRDGTGKYDPSRVVRGFSTNSLFGISEDFQPIVFQFFRDIVQ